MNDPRHDPLDASRGADDSSAELVRLRNENKTMRDAIAFALSHVGLGHQDRPFTDPDLNGDMVPIRLTGLCHLAEIMKPGCRNEAIKYALLEHPADSLVSRTEDELRAELVSIGMLAVVRGWDTAHNMSLSEYLSNYIANLEDRLSVSEANLPSVKTDIWGLDA
jgi:hypothetical protein